MPDGRQLKPLSSGDALFLYLEREGAPLSVAAICAFEGAISLRRCTEYIASKLPLVPRYLQRVITPPFNLGLPIWEDDPSFDVHNHVREITLKHGTEAEFKAVAGRIMSSTLPRERPLWDFTLLHGLKGNRTGLVIRTHHCLADGISGVGLMKIILDHSPTPAPSGPLPLPKEKAQEQAPPLRTPSPEESLLNSCLTTADRVITAQFELLQMARQLVASRTQNGNGDPATTTPGVAMPPEDLRHLIPEFGSPTQRLPFNVVCRGPQKFGWAEVSLPEIKGVKEACESTVNDVVLTILTSAIARYAKLHCVPLKNRFLRIIVPVNLRSDPDAGDLGNCITFLPVNVPLDVRNPRKLVGVVRASVARARKAGTAKLVGFVGTLIECIPTPLQALLLPLAAQLPISACNTICTNVPGPKSPLYLLENKMLSCYPYVPIGGEMGMNCAVLTYNGIAYFGFSGDAHAIPDLSRLEKFALESFAELRTATGARAQRRNVRKRKMVAPSPPEALRSSATPLTPEPTVAVQKQSSRPQPHKPRKAQAPQEGMPRSREQASAARA